MPPPTFACTSSSLLAHELALLDRTAKEAAESARLVPFADTLLSLPDERRRLEEVDGRRVAGVLARIGARADSLRASIEEAGGKSERDSVADSTQVAASRRSARSRSRRRGLDRMARRGR